MVVMAVVFVLLEVVVPRYPAAVQYTREDRSVCWATKYGTSQIGI